MLALDWPTSMECGSGGKSLQDIETTYSWFGFKVFLFFLSASAKSQNCPHSPTSTRWIDPILRPTLAPNQISVWAEVFPSAKLLLRAFQNPQSWYLISNSVGLRSYPLHHWFVWHSSALGHPPRTPLPAKRILVCLTSSYSHNTRHLFLVKIAEDDCIISWHS